MTEKTDISALRDSAQCMANVLDNLAGYEPQDIDMDTVEMRFEDGNGFDTGCDTSIVDTAQKSADIIRSLLDQLEAERQRANESGERFYKAVQYGAKLEAELAALRGDQEPDGYIFCHPTGKLFWSIVSETCAGDDGVRPYYFTRQPKPVVVLPALPAALGDFTSVAMKAVRRMDMQALHAAGIVVKDGEKETPKIVTPYKPLQRCAAGRDGECTHSECPQLRDNEPHCSGRHCPIDTWDDE